MQCKTMIFVTALVLTGALSITSGAADTDESKEDWTPLFNGKNLDGWTIKVTGSKVGENYKNTFRVEDGVLKVRYDEYEKFDGRFGHIFCNTPYSHYRLRMEYRFVGDQCPGGPGWAFRNSGVMIHGQTPESMDKNQDFPVSIEVQLLGGNPDGKGNRSTLNLCTPGTHVVLDGKLHTKHCTKSTSKTYHGDRWISCEIEVRGNKLIRHIVDGETVLLYTQPQLDPKDKSAKKIIEKQGGDKMLSGGTISLQAESHPCEFRNIEILELDDASPSASTGASDPWTALFDGKTLNGWTQRNGTATYRVENGSIVGRTTTGSPNAFLCTDKEYGDFELLFEVKVHDQLNSGVQIRSQTRGGPTGRVNGPQVEIEAGRDKGGEAGYLYAEAAGGWMTPNNQRKPHKHFMDGQWNSYRVLAVGPRIQVWVNGVQVSNLTDEKIYQSHPKGFIGLQVHSTGRNNTLDVAWRNIKLREIR